MDSNSAGAISLTFMDTHDEAKIMTVKVFGWFDVFLQYFLKLSFGEREKRKTGVTRVN